MQSHVDIKIFPCLTHFYVHFFWGLEINELRTIVYV